MSREQTANQQEGKFYSVIGGKFHTKVPENHPDAVSRVNKNGITVYEKEVQALFGKIENITVYDGDFGKNLNIALDVDENGEVPVASFVVESRDAEDVMKKLPNIDFTKEVKIAPYRFTPEGESKEKSGVSIFQPDEGGRFTVKLTNYFYDGTKNLHGFPSLDWDTATDAEKKIYFIQANAFLLDWTEKNILPKSEKKDKEMEYPTEEIDPSSIPF